MVTKQIPEPTEKVRLFLKSSKELVTEKFDLLHSHDVTRRNKWIGTVDNMDFNRSSRKSSFLLKKILIFLNKKGAATLTKYL